MKILIAEDDPSFCRLLKEKLTMWGYDVVVAENGKEALEILLSDGSPRLAMLDWMMPGMEGIEVCRKVREKVQEPYTYIILLTAQQRDEDLVAGMEAGADDYITKPFKHNELRLRLRAGRRIIELQSELIEARDRFQEKAAHDSLTGLWNHGEILRILDQELARTRRTGDCLSVIMADIDYFKKINDTYGHLAGDTVLRAAAARMHALMRSYDYVGRYGGEEFLIILPECCIDCAAAFAERLRTAIGDDSVDTSEGLIRLTISMGVASSGIGVDLQPKADILVMSADEALYRAKEKGRNRVETS